MDRAINTRKRERQAFPANSLCANLRSLGKAWIHRWLRFARRRHDSQGLI